MATCVVSSNESAYVYTFFEFPYIIPYIINSMVGMIADVEVPTEVPHNVDEIVLVRHGETTWNNAGRIQGSLESELNEAGWKQAYAIAARLGKELKPAAIYSSDLKRAKNTAEMIAKTCQIPEVREVPELKERHVGSLQGYYWREIQEKEPEAYRAFFSSEKDLEIPGGGESFNQLCERSVSALEEIASKHKVHLTEKKWVFKTWSDVSHLNEVGFLQRGFNVDAFQQ
ncbi:hypothetical protein MKX01_011176 [Papaver californicum]|nr:hypothetical protein MKX01_011176 [Papaver californicum]